MKSLLLAFGLIFTVGKAHAIESVYDIGYSSIAFSGIRCSTGTAIQINASRPAGFTGVVVGYRVQNQDSADAVWLGGVNVSTDTALVSAATLSLLGERLDAGANGVYPVNRDGARTNYPRIDLYCKAADAAGTAGAILSVVWFGL